MALTTHLDAMIGRADFALIAEAAETIEPIQTLSIESLGQNSMLVPLLRKPDFQRETNHWTPRQVVSFLESFLDNELIPSIILWKSQTHVFVIDGAHRLSALRAWIEDDYGAGAKSRHYFGNDIGKLQEKAAKQTKDLVAEKIGTYQSIREALINSDGHSEKTQLRARNMALRQLSLQWVSGDADKAESSFFKINTQGTPLDDKEEILLRNRERSVAISARSIVRAASGHKYWSKFNQETKNSIEKKSSNIHKKLFSPDIVSPVKTLDLPIGGAKSPLDALAVLLDVLAVVGADYGQIQKEIKEFSVDNDGLGTIDLLAKFDKILSRITGNDAASLGLHPAVYFYTEKGRHIPDLFLGIVLLFREKIESNDKAFFCLFCKHRELIEEIFISKKVLITQALQLARSKERFLRVRDLHDFLVENLEKSSDISDEQIVKVLAPASKSAILSLGTEGGPANFSEDTKSQIFIRDALKSALRCPICKGLVEPQKSVSFDHIERKSTGGPGVAENGQMTHPFCNTGVKG